MMPRVFIHSAGARIENILEFKNDYADYQLFKLEQNYRSTQTIVNAANTIIANNEGQIQKKVFSMNEAGEKIQVLQAMTDSEEGFNVSSDIFDKKLSQQLNWSILQFYTEQMPSRGSLKKHCGEKISLIKFMVVYHSMNVKR